MENVNFTKEELDLILDCLRACVTVSTAVKANSKAKQITKLMDKFANYYIDLGYDND